jgi:SulP family sulfate permease
MRRIPISDALVIIVVTIVTVLTDLAIAVIVGVIISALVYAWNNARRIHANTSVDETGTKIYEIQGPLFFGSAEGFDELFDIAGDPENVIVDFANSRVVDQSALQAIEKIASKYEAANTTLQLRHLSPDCHSLLTNAGQLVVGSEDDPDYGLSVEYGVKLGRMGGGH